MHIHSFVYFMLLNQSQGMNKNLPGQRIHELISAIPWGLFQNEKKRVHIIIFSCALNQFRIWIAQSNGEWFYFKKDDNFFFGKRFKILSKKLKTWRGRFSKSLLFSDLLSDLLTNLYFFSHFGTQAEINSWMRCTGDITQLFCAQYVPLGTSHCLRSLILWRSVGH